MTGLDKNVSGRFVDMLAKLRQIIKHTSGVPSVTDSAENVTDGFRLPSVY